MRNTAWRNIACLAAAAVLLVAPADLALAQSAPDSASPAVGAAPAAPAAAPASPPAAAPAAQSANPPAAATPPAAPTATTEATHKAKRKKTTGMSRRQEIDRSIDSGTVPSRYRSSVPKEYQHYIPFSKD